MSTPSFKRVLTLREKIVALKRRELRLTFWIGGGRVHEHA
jgi:hypothetical protein